MEKIVILASLTTNSDQLRRIHLFAMTPLAYTSLDEAIEAAKSHYRTNYASSPAPQFRVYESSDPDGAIHALVEVSEGHNADMMFTALYKVIAWKYGFRKNS